MERTNGKRRICKAWWGKRQNKAANASCTPWQQRLADACAVNLEGWNQNEKEACISFNVGGRIEGGEGVTAIQSTLPSRIVARKRGCHEFVPAEWSMIDGWEDWNRMMKEQRDRKSFLEQVPR